MAEEEKKDSAPKKAKKGKKKVSFMKGVKQEFKKITWPDKEALTKQSIAVVTTSVVLAGMIASLTAQGTETFYAAALGVYLHGLAADKLAQNMGLAGILPRDIPTVLPEIIRQ